MPRLVYFIKSGKLKVVKEVKMNLNENILNKFQTMSTFKEKKKIHHQD